MGFSLGIVGLPNVGKSTLFNLLSKAKADVSNYPFTTINPNIGVVEVPDDRLKQIKQIVGSAMFMSKPLTADIKGQDIVSGLPRIVTVTSDDVTEALQRELDLFLNAVKDVLHETPPELSADVMDKGIVLTGGSALLRNLDELIAQATGVPTYVADEPLFCAVKGTGIALENIESYKRSILATR